MKPGSLIANELMGKLSTLERGQQTGIVSPLKVLYKQLQLPICLLFRVLALKKKKGSNDISEFRQGCKIAWKSIRGAGRKKTKFN